MNEIIDDTVLLALAAAKPKTLIPFSLMGDIAASSWRQDAVDVENLNAQVREKVKVLHEDSLKSGVPLSVEVLAVLSNNRVVYAKRFLFFPLCSSIVAAFWILRNCWVENTIIAICSYLWYDFFSGVLHIMLDNPDFIDLPLLGQPCLEFQWHHHLPRDIASKSYLAVCADLNVTFVLMLIVYCCPGFGFEYLSSKTAMSLIGTKLLMAYFGQLCHRMSHTPPNMRPSWVNFLQRNSFMISAKEHNVHHHHHDRNFCIGSGICNPLINFLRTHVTSNKWLWFGLFWITVVADVPVIKYLLTLIL